MSPGVVVAMKSRIGVRTVTSPSGVEWRMGRRWLGGRIPRFRRVTAEAGSDIAWQSGNWLPGDVADWGDLEGWLVAVVALVLIVFVLIPLLLFGVELIVLGAVVAASLIGRLFLGRPWVVAARSNDGQVLTWNVKGWRRSGRLLDDAARALATGDALPVTGQE
jgi:hypothetical protein